MELTPQEMDKLLAFLSAEVAESPRLDAWIEVAGYRVSRSYFGKAYIYALSLMVMHKAALADLASEGAAGAITQKREGDISISYANGSNSGNGDLSATTYGQEYLTLLSQYSPRPGITGGSACCRGLDGGDRIQSFI